MPSGVAAVSAPNGLAIRRRRAGEVLLAVVALLSVPVVTVLTRPAHLFAIDFNGWFWPAGLRVLHGESPYSLPVLQAFHYPAVGAFLFVPFSVLPRALGEWVFTGLVLGSVPATLAVLRIRDWRVYAVVLLWQPVVFGWQTANISLIVVLGVAAVWRLRDRPKAAGMLLALLVSVKLFLIPLAVWLLATRRYAVVAWGVVGTVVLNAIAWPLLGLHQVSQYARLLHAFTAQVEGWGYSVVSLLEHQGVGRTGAYAATLALALCAVGAGALAGVRGDDRGALIACLGASLLASPIVESHYLALLMIPLALRRPRISPVWFVPVLLWVGPIDHPLQWQRLSSLVLVAAVFAIATWGRRRSERPQHDSVATRAVSGAALAPAATR